MHAEQNGHTFITLKKRQQNSKDRNKNLQQANLQYKVTRAYYVFQKRYPCFIFAITSVMFADFHIFSLLEPDIYGA